MGRATLNGRDVSKITAYLMPFGIDDNPNRLARNSGGCFMGSVVLGMGMTFDENGVMGEGEPCEEPNPISLAINILKANPDDASVVKPYIGGEELNRRPDCSFDRYVIDFGRLGEAECRSRWPLLYDIAKERVKPVRLRSNRENYKKYWWQFAERCDSLYEAVRGLEAVIAVALTSNSLAFARIPNGAIYANSLLVFPYESGTAFALLQSRVHEIWARNFGSTMKDDQRYIPRDCFDTFPFPGSLSTLRELDYAKFSQSPNLCLAGDQYHQYRKNLMISRNEGLTTTYNRFHDPGETSSDIEELHFLHSEMDQAVLRAYGWSDVITACGFGLDYLDLEEDAELPEDLQERIDSGELFFWEPYEACAFEAQVRAYGAVKGKKKLPWRYRWPDAVRDDVLARLLALNAELYAEEVAQGLHGKGYKKAAGPAEPGAKRRGRPPKSAQAGETGSLQAEQMGLGF